MQSAFGVEHFGVVAKRDRTSRLAGDAALLGGGAVLADAAHKAATPYAGRSTARAAGALLRADPKGVRRAALSAVAARKAGPALRHAKLGMAAGAAALGAAALDSAVTDRGRPGPDLPPKLGSPRKGRYTTS